MTINTQRIETLLAERGLAKDDLIFVDALGWLWWNRQKWERDDHKATA